MENYKVLISDCINEDSSFGDIEHPSNDHLRTMNELIYLDHFYEDEDLQDLDWSHLIQHSSVNLGTTN